METVQLKKTAFGMAWMWVDKHATLSAGIGYNGPVGVWTVSMDKDALARLLEPLLKEYAAQVVAEQAEGKK